MLVIWLDDMIFTLHCLSDWELYLKIWKTLAKLLFDMPKSYQSHMMLFIENLIHICDPWEKFCHAFMIKIHVHTIYPLLCFYEKLALYHPLIQQNKCSTICVGLSLQFLLKKKKRGIGYQEKKWTHQVQILKKNERKKKNMDTWRSKYWKKVKKKRAHEGPWKKENR